MIENFKRKLRVLITGFGVVIFWKGIWDFADAYIFPNNVDLNIITCLLLGIIILYLIKYENF